MPTSSSCSKPRWEVNQESARVSDAVRVLLHLLGIKGTNSVQIVPISLHSHYLETQPEYIRVNSTSELSRLANMEYGDLIEFARQIDPILIGVTRRGMKYVRGIGEFLSELG